MLTTERIRQILEDRDYTVDITCEPFGSVPGFVSAHLTGYPGRKLIINVSTRILGVQDRLVEKIAEAERARECQEATVKQTSPTSTLDPMGGEDGSSR